ncbi:hypothetical protein [Gluconobacter japonicus]|uniref:hypothetical protein n=1 Tax=Gluconobacter japonicus TaxID=376620 RepID=UPI0007867A48|nr:hypothetical protein [Gluconobacter japonicus]KXV20627.1 hypothetical protein AD935_11115 [Gluconobacter japonicus]
MKPPENSEKQGDFPYTELGSCGTIPAMKTHENLPETDVWLHCVDTSAHSLLPAIDWNAACAKLRARQVREMALRASTLSAECGDERFGCQSSSVGMKVTVREDMAVGAIKTEGDFGMEENGFTVAKRTIWDKLGFGEAHVSRPLGEGYAEGMAPGFFVTNVRVVFDWKDRLRTLVSGKIHVEVVSQTNLTVARAATRAATKVMRP